MGSSIAIRCCCEQENVDEQKGVTQNGVRGTGFEEEECSIKPVGVNAISGSASSTATLTEMEMHEVVSAAPAFRRLPPTQQEILKSLCARRRFPKGHVLIRQRESGDAFYFIQEGICALEVSGAQVGKLSKGDYVGETSLSGDALCFATVVAKTPLSVIQIPKDRFKEAGLDQEDITGGKRQGVVGAQSEKDLSQPPSPKTDRDRALIRSALQDNRNLNAMVSLDDARITAMTDVAWEVVVPEGKLLIKQGSDDSDYFYMVKEGSFEFFVVRQDADDITGAYAKGGSFGELALIYDSPRAANIVAREQSIVWVIDRGNFKRIIAKSAAEKAKVYVPYLAKIEVFAPLSEEEQLDVATALVEMNFSKGETIFEQGEEATHFHMLCTGDVSVVKDSKEIATLKATADSILSLGDVALFGSETRAATALVTSEEAKTMALPKSFMDIFQQAKMLLGRTCSAMELRQEAMMKQLSSLTSEVERIPFDKLTKLGILGAGGFGVVHLVEDSRTSQTYALKEVSKGLLVRRNIQTKIIDEKNIHAACNSIFITKLFETYNEKQTLLFLLEAVFGGDLFDAYYSQSLHGSERHAKFYVAAVVYAFEHLHAMDILYRDLKPENILLTDKGFAKLTDFGLAKHTLVKTFTTCGTPNYFSPEMVSCVGHTNACDWWALGVLIYELMIGSTPFEGAAQVMICTLITKGVGNTVFPAAVKGPCEELIRALLQKDPAQRLPMRKGGSDNIKAAKWFAGFDWEGMKSMTIDPPYKPEVKSREELAKAKPDDLPPVISYEDDGSGWDAKFASFPDKQA